MNAVQVFLYAIGMCLLPITYAVPNGTDAPSTLEEYMKKSSTMLVESSTSSQRFPACAVNKTETHQLITTFSIVFSCCSNDAPVGTVWWFQGRILYDAKGKVYQNVFTNLNLIQTDEYSQLEIKNSSLNNTGIYECTSGNLNSSFSLHVRAPITKLFLEFNETDGWYYFACYGDEEPTESFEWSITGHNLSVVYNKSYDVVHYTTYGKRDASVLALNGPTSDGGNITVTCKHDNITISQNLEVEKNDNEPGGKNGMLFVIGMGATAVLISVLALSTYLALTYAWPVIKGRDSHPSSLYSVPSTSSVDKERRSNTTSRQDQDEEGGNTIPRDFSTDGEDGNSFERDLKAYGIDLQSFRSSDDYNEFWEAKLCDGEFTDKFVVRSLSGKATVDLLEEFRKFQISLGDLPTHPNVWTVLGCNKEKLPYRICYEFHASTTIREYLLSNFQSSDGLSENGVKQTQTLIALACGIANGMVFLKSYAFDHVALRTERILIDQTSRCKLYDFCLSSQSQQIAVSFLNESELLAWLAPELIFLEEYNQWTDIWAFGVAMWELWCGGRTPHCGKSRENLELDLRNQKFLVQPNNCPGAIYSLMLSCWKNNASERKMFNDIHKELTQLSNSTDTSWYDDYEYSSLPGSTFYTVLDNNYDKYNQPSGFEECPLEFL